MPSAVSGVGRVSGVSGVSGVSDKGFVPTVLLCFFLGVLGIHRFYVGKTGTGILQFVTLGGLGVWAMIDFILIIVGKFTDHNGRAIKPR